MVFKDLVPVKDLIPHNDQLTKKWSWDRVLRSPYIKQADVLQCFFISLIEDISLKRIETQL
jgi:trehalose/maltose hydrolase-like predicted phosphorylase